MLAAACLLAFSSAHAAPKSPSELYGDNFQPRAPAPFPAAFKNYQILPGSISPDHRYGLLYPKRTLVYSLPDTGLYLAQLKPFRILTEIPLRYSNLCLNANCDYNVQWSPNSSAVIMVEGIKWGADKVFLIPVHDGKSGKITDLTAAVRKQMRPYFAKAAPEHYNDIFDYVFVDDEEAGWTFLNAREISIKTTCDNEPNNVSTEHWTMRFEGTWDIAAARFTHVKIKRVPFGGAQ